MTARAWRQLFGDVAAIVLLLAIAMLAASLLGGCTDFGPSSSIDLHTLSGALVADGNSYTDAVRNNFLDWFSQLKRVMAPTVLEWRNVAASGHTTRQLIESAPLLVDPLIQRPGVHVVVMWEGAVDLVRDPGGITAEQAIVNIKRYAADRRRVGWYVILVSITPRTPGEFVTPREYEDRRNRVNNWLRVNWRSIADGFVDIGGDSELGQFEANLRGAPWWQDDKDHFSPAGELRIRDLMRPEIERVLRLAARAGR